MATVTSIANEMAKRFICAKDKKYALNMIIYDMNYLVYSHSKEPLSYKAKSHMFTYIFDVIAGRQALQLKDGEEITPDFKDIVIFFERRDFILKRLRAGIKQQGELN
jgi:hypothetical protein